MAGVGVSSDSEESESESDDDDDDDDSSLDDDEDDEEEEASKPNNASLQCEPNSYAYLDFQDGFLQFGNTTIDYETLLNR